MSAKYCDKIACLCSQLFLFNKSSLLTLLHHGSHALKQNLQRIRATCFYRLDSLTAFKLTVSEHWQKLEPASTADKSSYRPYLSWSLKWCTPFIEIFD